MYRVLSQPTSVMPVYLWARIYFTGNAE